VRPSTVASAIQTQAEFGVRVAAMGQVITEIGIMRDTPDGGVGSAHRMSAARSAGHYRYPISPRFGTLKAMLAKTKALKPVTAPSLLCRGLAPACEAGVAAQKRRHARSRR
jgi:hypothetical protein